MKNSLDWLVEFWRFLFVIGCAAVVGLLLQQVWMALFFGCFAYLVLHGLRLQRLLLWLRDEDSELPPEGAGIWGVVFDQQYRLERRHVAQKDRLRVIIKRYEQSTAALPDAAVVLGSSGQMQWWNDAAETLLGLKSPQDIGQSVTHFVRHPDFITYLDEADYQQPVAMPAPTNEKITLSVPINRYGAGQRLLVARDVTQLQRLEQLRRDFVANVSHELRTPVTVISGYLETLMDQAQDFPPRWQMAFNQMQHQSLRMAQLIEDLLLLARLEAGSLAAGDEEPISVLQLCEQVAAEGRALSGDQNHHISVACEPEWALRGNASELRSAFSNLVSNAVRYTPAEGRIVIRAFYNDNGVFYEVQDTGIGVDVAHIPRLTERFYRVDDARSRDTGGTGLGLAIVKHVLLRHAGRLEVDSQPGVGSCFRCCFPVARLTNPDI